MFHDDLKIIIELFSTGLRSYRPTYVMTGWNRFVKVFADLFLLTKERNTIANLKQNNHFECEDLLELQYHDRDMAKEIRSKEISETNSSW